MARRKKKDLPQPSEFEMQILGVLWNHGVSTVRQVMNQLTDGKPRAYTSVLSVMQVMQKKGLLLARRSDEGPANVYEPAVRREDVLRPLFRGLVKRVYGGSTSSALQHLIAGEQIGSDEIDELRQLLDEIESRQRAK